MTIVIGFKFCSSILLNFSMPWRVSSCSYAASVSEEIGASFFVVDANKEESIMLYVFIIIIIIIIIVVSVAQPTSSKVSTSECGCECEARISIKPIDLRQPANGRCDL